MAKTKQDVLDPQVESLILTVREQKVFLDRDLAALYHVETKALNRAVARNVDRFPEDFVFRLTGLKRNSSLLLLHALGG